MMAVRQTQTFPQDLPVYLWGVFPPAMLIVLVFMAFVNPQFFLHMLAKDVEGGIVEHATVLVLIPGIAAGFAAFFFHRQRLPYSWLGWWILMWTLACVYFAGEEVSWGQWLFNWETPEAIKQLNTQQETNLHNITPWLFQKPQAMVELWIFIAGLVMPLWRRTKRDKTIPRPQTWNFWVFPSYVCTLSAGLTVLVRLFRSILGNSALPHLERLGSSELREYYIALFLCLYLISFWYRVRQIKGQAAH
jgi:hypothetical protein